jgi:hypothetical protein
MDIIEERGFCFAQLSSPPLAAISARTSFAPIQEQNVAVVVEHRVK